MTTNITQLARSWLSHEVWGIEARPEKDIRAVAKAALICAQGDGNLSPAERDWLIGAYAARGVPADLIDELRDYQGKEDLVKVLEAAGVAREGSRLVVYFAIQTCAADGALHDLELAAIVKMGALLGVTEDVVKELAAVYNEEQAVRQKRIKLAFPDGPPAL